MPFLCIYKRHNLIKNILTTTSNVNLLLRCYKHLTSFFHLILNLLFTTYFVITVAWFHSFARFKMGILPYVLFLCALGFILSSAPRLNFYHMFCFYVCLISFFHPFLDWIFTIRFVLTSAWFRSFTYFKVDVSPYTPLLRSLGFIPSPSLRLDFYHTLCFYVRLVSFFHPLQDWIITIRFVLTFAWFHSFTRS